MDWIEEFYDLMFPPERENVQTEKAMKYKYKHIPSSLYRYRSFEDDYALHNLRRSQLWFTSVENFNDPFDSGISISPGIFDDYLSDNVDEIRRSHGDELPFDDDDFEDLKESDRFIYEMAKKGMKQSDDIDADDVDELAEGVEEAVQEVFQEDMEELQTNITQQGIRVCSFSEINDSFSMWSYYGMNHEGFCIEIDKEELLEFNHRLHRIIFPIHYSTEFFKIDDFFAPDRELEQTNLFYLFRASMTKSTDWAHENEWRFISNFFEEDTSVRVPISSVYLGVEVSDENREEILDIASSVEFRVYQMEKELGEFVLNGKCIYPEES